MRDPFVDQSNNKLRREVQVWMAGLACLLIAFLYLSLKRMTDGGEQIPAHVPQAGVAYVSPPLENKLNAPPLPNTPQPSIMPAVAANRFSAKPRIVSPTKSPRQPHFGFPEPHKPTKTFAKVSSRSAERAPLKPNPQLQFPEPKFIVPTKLASAKSAADASAMELGRRRARQLAAMTSGLPKQLNQIQSSIKRASADLPVKKSVETTEPSNDNGFVSAAPASNRFALVEPTTTEAVKASPSQPVAAKPIASNPLGLKPHAESSKPIKPYLSNSFPGSPARRPNAKLDSPANAITSPTKVQPLNDTPAPNSFQPLTAAVAPLATTKSRPLKKSTLVIEPPQIAKHLPKADRPAAQKPESLRTSGSTLRINEVPERSQPVSTSKQHIVQAGDSFYTIAQQEYGDGQWFRALRLANRALVAGDGGLQPGMSLSIPTTEELARQFPDQAFQSAAKKTTEAERRIYVTQAGDTLFDIARRKTGQGSRFSEIIRANDFTLPTQIRPSDQLPADLRLVLPESTLH